MVEAKTWRELLGQILFDAREKERVAHKLNINPVTLTRWIDGRSLPRPKNLQDLLDALPEHREQLRTLLSEEYSSLIAGGEASSKNLSATSSEIPAAFYAHVLDVYMTSSPTLRSFITIDSVLQQALHHLDPERRGMSIVLVQCVPPPDKQTLKVHSLREMTGRGNSPWSTDYENQAIMLGAESLPGYATVTGKMIFFNDRTQWQSTFPMDKDSYENSIVASPLIRMDRVAGCVTITSTQSHYFTQAHLNLIQRYTQLLLLAFDEASFYPLRDLELGIMPPAEVQRPVLQSFRQHVTDVLLKLARQHQSIDLQQAEKIAWKQLEEELLAKALDLANSN